MAYHRCYVWGHSALCNGLANNDERRGKERALYCEKRPSNLSEDAALTCKIKAVDRHQRQKARKVGVRFSSRLHQTHPWHIKSLLKAGWTGYPVSFLIDGGSVGRQWRSRWREYPNWAYKSCLITHRGVYRERSHKTGHQLFRSRLDTWFAGRCYKLHIEAQAKVWRRFPGLESLEFKSLKTRRKWTRKLGKHIQNMTFKVHKLEYQRTDLPGFGERPWFGLEWELIGVNEEDPTPYIELPGKLARRVDMKSDSSLEIGADPCNCEDGCDNCEGEEQSCSVGVEMAFAPASFREAKKLARAVASYLPWDRIVEQDFRPGVHVHVDTNAVDIDVMEQMFTSDLYDKHSIDAQLFRKWAIRAPNDWCHPEVAMNHGSAVNRNALDGKTVEFRSFASRGRPHWGARCIDATAALVYWAKCTRSKNPTWKMFFKWTAQHQDTYNIFGPIAAQALKEVL